MNITFADYINLKNDIERYRNEVNRITYEQPIHLLEHHEKRGKAGLDGAYHLDHIIPVRYGFDNNIEPEIIGNIKNLRFIPWLDNIQKGSKETDECWDMFQYFIEQEII